MALRAKDLARVSLAAACLAGAASASTARADENPTPAQMMEQIRQLQAKVERLEASQASPNRAIAQPNAVTPNSIPGDASNAVKADAEHRAAFFDVSNPFTAGYDPGSGFVLRSEDGNFSLNPHLLLAARNVTNYREKIASKGGGETNAAGYDTQNGFEVTRLRLVLQGSFAKQLTYFVQFSADQGVNPFLVDAYAAYRFGQSPFSLRVGQFKDPLWHERNLSESNLMAVDRSILENLLGGEGTSNSRVQGAALVYDQDRLRGQAVIHDGFASINSKFFDAGGLGAGISGASGVTPDDFGVSGRVEFLAIGHRTASQNPFTQYDSGFTSLGAKQNILVLGGGVDFTQAGSNDLLLHTVDAQFNTTSGISIYAAYLGAYRALHANQGVAPGYFYDPGFLLQVAYLINQRFEPFARYDWTHLDPSSVTGLASHVVQEITVGVNYYLYRQNAKLTLDASYFPDGSPIDADNLGILKDSGNNEFVLRGQFQLAI